MSRRRFTYKIAQMPWNRTQTLGSQNLPIDQWKEERELHIWCIHFHTCTHHFSLSALAYTKLMGNEVGMLTRQPSLAPILLWLTKYSEDSCLAPHFSPKQIFFLNSRSQALMKTKMSCFCMNLIPLASTSGVWINNATHESWMQPVSNCSMHYSWVSPRISNNQMDP